MSKRKRRTEALGLQNTPNCRMTRRTVITSTEGVCSRCGEIVTRMHRAPASPGSSRNNIATVYETRSELLSSSCAFCRLLASIMRDADDGSARGLSAYSANLTYARARPQTLQECGVSDSTLIGFRQRSTREEATMEPSDFIGIMSTNDQEERIGPRVIDAKKVDFTLVRAWISYCLSKHKGLCKPRVTKNLTSLRLIDIDTQKVVLAPKNCRYVALSYVWGSSRAETRCDENQGQLTFPQVVYDSFIVTREAGYRYLWVDKYCIDQNDATDKHDQIRAMHLVYGNAQFTIIAAAGRDSSYGLPGIGIGPRKEQGVAHVCGTTFGQTFPHASETLRNSFWATRAWTYQEGILSKRRLIFTEEQVSYQCNGMHCSEAVFWPYEAMHAKSSRMFIEKVPERPFPLTIGRNYYNDARLYFNLMSFINQYSQKSLSYDTDRLQAFLGILASFSERKDPIYHVWGVPVVKRMGHYWSMMLSWLSKKPGKRRHDFPSWSWAGWSGLPDHGFMFHLTSVRVVVYLLHEIPRETDPPPDGITIDEFVSNHAENQACALDPSRCLLLDVETTIVPFTLVRWSEEDKRSARDRLGNRQLEPDLFRDGLYAKSTRRGYHELAYFYPDNEEFDLSALSGKSLRAFKSESAAYWMCLIVVVKREGFWERLGFFQYCWDSATAVRAMTYELPDGSLTKTAPDNNPPGRDTSLKAWHQNFEEGYILLG